jgi:hypothetical protein
MVPPESDKSMSDDDGHPCSRSEAMYLGCNIEAFVLRRARLELDPVKETIEATGSTFPPRSMLIRVYYLGGFQSTWAGDA